VNTRVWLMILKLVCLLLAVTSSLCSSRPHIVFIIADDMVSTYNFCDDQSFISGVSVWNISFDGVTDSIEVKKKIIFSIIAAQADTLRLERRDTFMSKRTYYECPGYNRYPYVDINMDIFFNNQPDAIFIQNFSVIKLYMFRANSLPIIRSLLLCSRHW